MMLLHMLSPNHLVTLMNHNKLRVPLYHLNQAQQLPIMSTTMASPLIYQLTKRLKRGLGPQCLTCPRGYRASGPLGLGPGSGVCVTTLNTFNQGPLSKLACLQGPLLHAHISTAQFLHQGPAPKLGCLPGLLIWAYQAQEP